MQGQSIPDIETLRQRVHRDETKYGKIVWISKVCILPHVAIHFTRLFLRLGCTGDQVTLLMTLCAFIGPSLFLFGTAEAYTIGALLMLLSWVLDHSDGQVRRFRGEDCNLAIYLDRCTHRVSYPLQHIAMGISLYHQTGVASYLLFGGLVAYFYQLVVVQSLDKQLIQLQRDGIDPDPLRTVQLRLSTRFPQLKWPLRVLVLGYSQLIQNTTFVLLLIAAASLGYVAPFYMGYGTLIIFNWALRTLLDYTVVFPWNKRFTAPYGSITTNH